jgi:glycosyltransferase involved in cell wall biosynthesis
VTREPITVIATVKNEASSIESWMRGIECQTQPPAEVIVVDGGSNDGTWEMLQLWKPTTFPIRLLQRRGANISAGRNAAIQSASHDVIAVTDAGTVAHPDWIRHLTDTLQDDRVDVAAGFFHPVLDSRWSRCLAAATLPEVDEISATTYQPSSRSVAFRRRWWDAGVQYPEWLDYCEDLVWDMSLRRAGARFRTNTKAVVHFSVRPTFREYLRQYYRYARGDGKAGLFAARHAARYVTYVALAMVAWRKRPRELVATSILGGLYVRRPVERLLKRDSDNGLSRVDSLLSIPFTIALRAAGDVAKMAGYPSGLLWRQQTYGTLGWRCTWKRIDPKGILFRPAVPSREIRPLSSSRDGVSQADWT